MVLGIAALLWFSPCARGQAEPDGSPPPPPQIGISMEANPKSATVGDPIRLDMDIATPSGYQVEIPKPVSPTGDFFIVDFSSEPQSLPVKTSTESAGSAPAQAGAKVHHRAQIVIAVYKTGKFAFPSIPLKIKTAEGKEIAAASPPVTIEIRSVITEKDPKLKDLKKQAEIPESARWFFWILLIASVCVLCGIIWYLWRRRRRSGDAPPPVQTQDLLDIAEKDLRDLLARGLPGSGMEKRFYVDLSEIVKRILEAGYDIRASELTTAEIMDSLCRRPVPGPEVRETIESFLIRCDVVKFAKYVPEKAEHEIASTDALGILAEVRKMMADRQSLVGSG
jgi:hypothetical protein